jgi:secreted trypsin-like serine protease
VSSPRHASRLLSRALLLAALITVGTTTSALAVEPRIIAGDFVSITDHPYQVEVTFGNFSCGGSIRDATHVITAAHCVTDEEPFFPTIVPVGQVNVGYGNDDRANLTEVGVSRVSVFPAYLRDLGSSEFDVAVLTLASPINLSASNAKAIPLASNNELSAAAQGFATGWGLTEEDASAGERFLMGVALDLRDDSACLNEFGSVPSRGGYSPSTMICAGGENMAPTGNPDTCQGDSGGPLAIDTDPTAAELYKLIGVVNFGNGCGRAGVPGAYAWMQSSILRPFIENADPPAPPPAPLSNPTVSGTPRVGQTLTCNAPAPAGSQVTRYIWSVFNPTDRTFTIVAIRPGAAFAVPAALQGALLVCDARYENGGGFTYSDAPSTSAVGPVQPQVTPAARDTTRPRARIRSVRCRRGRCTIKVATSDVGGSVRSLSARLTYKVKRCRRVNGRKRCRAVKRTKKLRARKTSGGFTIVKRLAANKYSVTAVATDTSGNRSRTARKTFRVRRR